MKRLVVAFGFLTRVPMPRVEADATDFAAAIRWYPMVGLTIGAVVGGALWAGSLIDPWVGALAALVAWVAITGALHLDGLADLADGLGAAHGDRARLLSVMADPHIGSFGVVAIVVQLLAKLVLLHGIGWPVVLVPCVARIGPLVWARWLPPLRDRGLGAAVSGAVRWRDIGGWSAVLLGFGLLAPGVLVAPVAIAAFGWWLMRRVSGVSGDCHGAGIEWVETLLLLALVIASRL